jgi:hypothetical protein
VEGGGVAPGVLHTHTRETTESGVRGPRRFNHPRPDESSRTEAISVWVPPLALSGKSLVFPAMPGETTDGPRQGPAKPGWYRDPSQTATQRYWDGERWTGEHAPIEPEGEYLTPTPRFLLSLVAGALMIAALFLPAAELPGATIANDTIFPHSFFDSLVVALLGASTVLVGWATAERRHLGWELIALGIITLADANYLGGAEQLMLSGSGGLVQSADAGAAIWAMVAAGIVMVIAGLTWWKIPQSVPIEIGSRGRGTV